MSLNTLFLITNCIPPGEKLTESQNNYLYILQMERGVLIPPNSHNSYALEFLKQLKPLDNNHPVTKYLSKLTNSQKSLLSIEIVKYYQEQDKRMPIHFPDFPLHKFISLEEYTEKYFLDNINNFFHHPHKTKEEKYEIKNTLLEFFSKEEYIIKIKNQDFRIRWYEKYNKLPYYNVYDFMEVVQRYYPGYTISGDRVSSVIYLKLVENKNNRKVRNFLLSHKSVFGSAWVNRILRKKPIQSQSNGDSKKADLSYMELIKKINSLQSHWNLNLHNLPNLYEIRSKNTTYIPKNKIAMTSPNADMLIAYLRTTLKYNLTQTKFSGYGIKFKESELVDLALPMDLNYRYTILPRGSVIKRGEEFIINNLDKHKDYIYHTYEDNLKYGSWHNPYTNKIGNLNPGILYNSKYEVIGILNLKNEFIYLDQLPLCKTLMEDIGWIYKILYYKYKDYLKLQDLNDIDSKYEVTLDTNIRDFFRELLWG